ncbi:MAG: glycoside hydrolase family 2 TIM barrel-domain containing protein, partial [Bacteroidota bacterium]|nr:glycoside hydrolase family 2 TIM barrel-domain containing protein [Bacteroidota bacterium]
KPGGIMYTASSGIWQTVWMEEVPKAYIEGLNITPDVDNGEVIVTVNSNINAEIRLSTDNSMVVAKGNTAVHLKLANPHLWSPDDPYLYSLKVQLINKGKPEDEVESYFGMRKIEIKKDSLGQERIFLNNKYTFNLGVLDQGFWPDGIYTAPTDEALKWDIQAIKEMGFNTIRKHIKIEPARWYYWADKLGMLVWQDMVYPANLSAAGKAEFEKENEMNVAQLYDHPSIVCWVLFNEGWNSYDQERLTAKMKQMDPTRLIDGHTGENYDRNRSRDPGRWWINSDMTDIHDYPGPGIAPAMNGKARVLGEWGGVRVVTPGHEWDSSKGWGYIESGAGDFAKKYSFMVRHLKLFEEEGLSASIYTQPFDVEIEENGLITYDRELFKIPAEEMKRINAIMYEK